MDDVFDTSAEQGEVESLHENVQDFVQISEQLAENKTLTPELALESIPVLGHNGLLDTYYSVGSKQKRYTIATESFAKRLNELYRQAYELLKRIIRKCVDWVKSLFGGKKNAKETKEQIHAAEGSARLVVSAAQDAKDLREAKTFKEVVTSHKLDTEFFHGLTPTENDIFVDGPYMKSLLELVKELEHGNALTEISTQLSALDEWFKKVITEVKLKDVNGEPFTEQHTGMFYDEKSKSLVDSNRDSTDVMLKALWAARDAKESLPDATNSSEKIYDLVRMSDELERVITRISMNDTGPLLDRWSGVLTSVQAQLDAGIKDATDLATEGDKMEAEGINSKHRQTLSSQYLNALGTFGSRITQMQSAVMMIQSYMFTDSFNLYYKILSFLNKAAAAYQHEEPSEETYKLFQMTKDILAKRHS
jgi:hypothetical protein